MIARMLAMNRSDQTPRAKTKKVAAVPKREATNCAGQIAVLYLAKTSKNCSEVSGRLRALHAGRFHCRAGPVFDRRQVIQIVGPSPGSRTAIGSIPCPAVQRQKGLQAV